MRTRTPISANDGAVTILYLASTSPARLMLLRQAGIEPVVIPSHVDERAAEDAAAAERGAAPTAAETVLLLARLKAEAVLGPEIDGIVIGSDSAFEFGGHVYGKPLDAETATARWHAQRGGTGVLHSGHWVVDHRGGTANAATGAVADASVTFGADMTDAEIDAYVATGEPLGVAGAFTIDSLGGAFIDRVEGDPSTVVGLSLSLTRRLVDELGVPWSSLWNRT